MACRLINLSQQPLRVDLRGGDLLVIAPGHTSRALREELLYDNHNIGEWERAGIVTRVPARLSEVSSSVTSAMTAPAAPVAAKKTALTVPEITPSDEKTPHEKSRSKSQHSKK